MKRIHLFIPALALALAVAGCGYKEGVMEKEQAAFLLFSGNVAGSSAQVDDGEPFDLGPAYYRDAETGEQVKSQKEIHYRIEPGKHRIRVSKHGQVVVDRNLFVGNGVTKEIHIP